MASYSSRLLYPREVPQYQLNRWLGGPQSWSGHSGEVKISLASAGNQTPDCPDRSLVTILTELSRLSVHSKWENTFLEP